MSRWNRPMLCWAAAVTVAATAAAGEPRFRRHLVDPSSEFSAAAALDVDGDGRLDLVSGAYWYQAPAWQRHTLREVEQIRGRYDDYSNLPWDVDGDGRQDLVSANYRSRKLYWIQNTGAAQVPWPRHLVAEPGPMETAFLGDVDGDGQLDIVPNGTTFAAWWSLAPGGNGRAPQFTRHDLPAEVAGHGVGLGDVNGDGRADLVGPHGWLEAPADRRQGRWLWHADFQLDRDASIPILVVDVDQDGDNDLVWGRGHNLGLFWLEQDRTAARTGQWTRHAIDTSVSQAHSILWGPLDNASGPVLVAGKRYLGHDGRDPGEYDPRVVASYRFVPASRSWQRTLVSTDGQAGFDLDAKLVDLDGDGDRDFIAPSRQGLAWFENLGTAATSNSGDTADAAELSYPWTTAPAYPDHRRLLVLRDSEGGEQTISTPQQWAVRRMHLLAEMQRVMGALPGPEQRVPLEVQLHEETNQGAYLRRKISYATMPGHRIRAWLLVPNQLSGRTAAMLCLHQTTKQGKDEPAGISGKPNLYYAHELAQRGYVCLVPDYPSFGEYPFDFRLPGRLPSGSMQAIWDNLRGVDLLQSLDQVDHDRIGGIGHSLGGHNLLFTACFDQRLKALVTSCGFTPFHDYYQGKLAGWTSDRYMPRIASQFQNDPNQVPFDFYEIVAALAPRGLFTNSPLGDGNFDVAGVRKAISAAHEVYGLFQAEDRLVAEYPDSAHDFPPEQRESAYRYLDRWLKP